jgi:biotin carboxyl carrier protein
MDLQIEVNGRVRAVSVEPRDGAFRLVIDGRERLVDVARVDDATFSLIYLSDRQQSQETGLAETGVPGELAVHLPGGVATVRMLSGVTARFGRGSAGPGAVSGTRQVLAPMPGKVVKVLVKVGDTVALRQGLVVVEAMKMENELRSPKGGRVIEVSVAEGVTVEAGRVLVVVE